MSGVNYYVRLADEPSDDDHPRMTATRAVVAALTGVDTEHQGQGLSSGFSFGGYGPRWWSCRVEGPYVKREWREVADFLVRARLIDKYTWYGQVEETHVSWQEELQAMVAAYDGNGIFPEFAERYLQEHPSQYDFSTAIKYVVIEPKRKTPEQPITDEHIRKIVREEIEHMVRQLRINGLRAD